VDAIRKRLLNSFSLYLRLISVQFKSQLQYPASFLFDIAVNGINLFLYFVSLTLVFQRFQSIGGWSIGEVAFLWGLVEISFGLMDLVFSGFDPDAFSILVRQGGFDQLLLRPVNISLQVLGSRFVLRRLGRITEGCVILAISLALVNVHWSAFKVGYMLVVIASQVLFFGGLFIFGSTLTFWTIQPIEAVNILTYGGTEMMSYPMHIFPDWIRRFFTYIVPSIFLNFYPALYLLDKPDPLHLPGFAPFLAPIAGLFVLAAALLFWRFGLNHYQSTGS
jgi:ABC-2 type transport system permease protein